MLKKGDHKKGEIFKRVNSFVNVDKKFIKQI